MKDMTIYQWLCLLSVPALLAAIVKYLLAQIKAVRLGVQALLRAQMINDYNKWEDRGYAISLIGRKRRDGRSSRQVSCAPDRTT